MANRFKRIIVNVFSEHMEKGGSGSGNFGHAGRPGKVGGSAPADLLSPVGANDGIRSIGLKGLAAEANKCNTFEEFEKAYTIDKKHGLYWHITYDKDFKIDPQKGPRDMSSMASGKSDIGKLMITSDLPYWAESYGDEESTGGKPRGFAAMIDMSGVDPKDYYQVNRGMGNEFFVNDISGAKVLRTVSLDNALKLDEIYDQSKPQSREELRTFYNRVKNQK